MRQLGHRLHRSCIGISSTHLSKNPMIHVNLNVVMATSSASFSSVDSGAACISIGELGMYKECNFSRLLDMGELNRRTKFLLGAEWGKTV